MKGYVYLLHFEEPYYHAQHYLGWSMSPFERFQRHIIRCEQPLIRAVITAGISIEIVRIWDDVDRHFERRLKKRRNHPRLCPVCCNGGNGNACKR